MQARATSYPSRTHDPTLLFLRARHRAIFPAILALDPRIAHSLDRAMSTATQGGLTCTPPG